MTDSAVILGLDISLAACGLVAVPAAWGGDWSRVGYLEVGDHLPKGASEEFRIGRLHRITSQVVAFAQRNRCTVALCEGYAFGARFERERLGEIAGAIKLGLAMQCGLVVERLVAPMTARKLLLGANPKDNPKRVVRDHLRERGMPLVWTEGVVDAFVIANVKLHELGAPAFSAPAPVVTKKGRKAA